MAQVNLKQDVANTRDNLDTLRVSQLKSFMLNDGIYEIKNLALKLKVSQAKVYALLGSDVGKEVLSIEFKRLCLLAKKAVAVIDKALSIETDEPELILKQSDRAFTLLQGLGITGKNAYNEDNTAKALDVAKVLAQVLLQTKAKQGIEAPFEVIDTPQDNIEQVDTPLPPPTDPP